MMATGERLECWAVWDPRVAWWCIFRSLPPPAEGVIVHRFTVQLPSAVPGRPEEPVVEVDGPSGRSWDHVQRKVLLWVHRNFPGYEPWQALVGIGEELGELLEAWHDDPRSDEVVGEAGDVLLTIANFCAHEDIYVERDLLSIRTSEGTQDFGAMAPIWYSDLCRAVLKRRQRIRGGADVHHVNMLISLSRLVHAASVLAGGEDPLSIALARWDVVSRRDWTKDPERLADPLAEPPREPVRGQEKEWTPPVTTPLLRVKKQPPVDDIDMPAPQEERSEHAFGEGDLVSSEVDRPDGMLGVPFPVPDKQDLAEPGAPGPFETDDEDIPF